MITDAVTTSKILVGVVIKHAPAKASCNVLLGCHRIQNICMAERMLCPVFFPVKCLRRIHMPIVFTDEVWFFHIRCHILFRLTSLCFSIMHKIIVGIHIFQQTAFSVCTHTTCRSRIIELMCCRIRPSVKCIIILRFINAHAPEDDRRVIPVLFYHIPDIFHRLIFPCSVTDMLPPWNFCENKKSYFVTPLYKIMGLWIVGGTHCIHPQLSL